MSSIEWARKTYEIKPSEFLSPDLNSPKIVILSKKSPTHKN